MDPLVSGVPEYTTNLLKELFKLEKVTARIVRGRTDFSLMSHVIRSTRVLVLPVPGPAVTRSAPKGLLTASSCA